ncbi:DUF3592 domain-containing protein [Sphingomonas sp.]|jgi:hypothetical protein|uniref:DUF3592 domain-containing protein n=1 Tax=Sphingomonas sp. TaxID=28214 RepID=UPI002E30629F|nr:DUF3592 domain-containing protein [Sphingomonas sp.]HEX4693138.1 DUF3592 domain-containing protein [Sphingomonas sp.]
MRDFITFATPALMLGLLYCLYRAATLFAAWRPAAAVVWGSDYTDAERRDDFWGFGTLRGWRITDGDHQRLIEETVHYQDADGEAHVTEVKRYVRAGWRPSGAHIVWYDTADPDRATALGPGYWLLSAGGLAVALVMLISTAMQHPA